MNSIFKSAQGFHIDLSKIVAISGLYTIHAHNYYFHVDIQLMDKPMIVSSYDAPIYYEKPEQYDEEVRIPLINAWIAYRNNPLNSMPQALFTLPTFDLSKGPTCGTNAPRQQDELSSAT